MQSYGLLHLNFCLLSLGFKNFRQSLRDLYRYKASAVITLTKTRIQKAT